MNQLRRKVNLAFRKEKNGLVIFLESRVKLVQSNFEKSQAWFTWNMRTNKWQERWNIQWHYVFMFAALWIVGTYIKSYHQFYEHSINIIFCLNCCFMPLPPTYICTTYSIDYLLLDANTATNSPFLTKLLSDASPKRPLKTHSLQLYIFYTYYIAVKVLLHRTVHFN